LTIASFFSAGAALDRSEAVTHKIVGSGFIELFVLALTLGAPFSILIVDFLARIEAQWNECRSS
jgi:hypothetical protein